MTVKARGPGYCGGLVRSDGLSDGFRHSRESQPFSKVLLVALTLKRRIEQEALHREPWLNRHKPVTNYFGFRCATEMTQG